MVNFQLWGYGVTHTFLKFLTEYSIESAYEKNSGDALFVPEDETPESLSSLLHGHQFCLFVDAG